jgi:hypothetical protein
MFQKNDLTSYDGAEDFLCQEQTRNLFGQPDVLLVHEYLHVYQSSVVHTPEVKLMLAVLKDAIDCYLKYVSAKQRRARKLSNEAEQWFFSDEDDWLYSFQSVCDILKLDPDYIRRALLRYKQAHAEAAAGAHGIPTAQEPPVDNLRLAS